MTSEIRTNSITSRAGMSTVTMTDSGPMFSGITTFVDNSGFTFGVGGGTSIFTPATNVLTFGTNNTEKIRIDASGHMHGVGVITATHFYGDGSNLTGISAGTSLSGSTNNTVCTVTGANAIQGEANLTYDGTSLKIGGDSGVTGTWHLETYNSGGDGNAVIAGVSGAQLVLQDTVSGETFKLAANGNASLYSQKGGDDMIFYTKPSGGSDTEGLRITSNGDVGIGDNNPNIRLTVVDTGTDNLVRLGRSDGNSHGSHTVNIKASKDFYHNFKMEASTYQLHCYDGSSMNERFRINSNGECFIGASYHGNSNRSTDLSVTGPYQSPAGVWTQVGIYSDDGQAADKGGTIGFGGQDGSTAQQQFAAIKGAKANSTSGNYEGYMSFFIRPNGAVSQERFRITSSDATLSGATDGVLNLDTTDSRGSFIRFQQGGATEAWVGCGQGLSLGGKTTLALRSDADIRIRTGAEEHVTITTDGMFAAKGQAGNWIYGNHPSNYSGFHQFSSSKNGDWMMQFRQEHHNGLGFVMRVSNSGNNEAIALYRENTSNYGFKVYQNGNVQNSNNSYGSLSDVSLKENIVDAKSQWNDIKEIKVRNFNLKSDDDKVKMLGVVAQELETVSPKLVFEDKDGVKGVHYSVLYMKAIKALQEAMTRIETLEQDNIALRARVTNLEGE